MLVSCHRCNKNFQKNPCKVKKAEHVFCSPDCHYQWRRDLPDPSRQELIDTFFDRIVQSDEESCWPWVGPTISRGYGWVSFRKGRGGTAHRFSYEIHKGCIKDGEVVRHTCDNPWCVNPNHLLTGTHQDNMTDKKVRGRARRDRASHVSTKLGPDDVRVIRTLSENGHSQRDIARRFDVARTTVADVIHLRTWAYVAPVGYTEIPMDNDGTATNDSPLDDLVEGQI